MPETAPGLNPNLPLGPGSLVLIVGPSGAGKDTLLGYARERLQGSQHVLFPRRIITRPAEPAVEDHDTVDEAEFGAMLAEGRFALHWSAHGLHYGIPCTIDQGIGQGRVVVINVSRRIVAAAQARYAKVLSVEVTAPAALLAQRLGQRGRENAAAIEHRLARTAENFAGADCVQLINDGPVARAGERLLAIIADQLSQRALP